MKASELKIGKTYMLEFPNGDKTVAKLEKIEKYPSTSFPWDYFFKYVSGDKRLVNVSAFKI